MYRRKRTVRKNPVVKQLKRLRSTTSYVRQPKMRHQSIIRYFPLEFTWSPTTSSTITSSMGSYQLARHHPTQMFPIRTWINLIDNSGFWARNFMYARILSTKLHMEYAQTNNQFFIKTPTVVYPQYDVNELTIAGPDPPGGQVTTGTVDVSTSREATRVTQDDVKTVAAPQIVVYYSSAEQLQATYPAVPTASSTAAAATRYQSLLPLTNSAVATQMRPKQCRTIQFGPHVTRCTIDIPPVVAMQRVAGSYVAPHVIENTSTGGGQIQYNTLVSNTPGNMVPYLKRSPRLVLESGNVNLPTPPATIAAAGNTGEYIQHGNAYIGLRGSPDTRYDIACRFMIKVQFIQPTGLGGPDFNPWYQEIIQPASTGDYAGISILDRGQFNNGGGGAPQQLPSTIPPVGARPRSPV